MSVIFNDFDMPEWKLNFIPSKSDIIDGDTIYQMEDTGTIGINAVRKDPAYPVILKKNVFGMSFGADVSDINTNRHFICNSLSAYNFLHNSADNATLFCVINPDITSFLYILGNIRNASYNEIGIALSLAATSPDQLRLSINNGDGIDNAAYIQTELSFAGLMVIAVKKTPTTVDLWLNGTPVGQSVLTLPSALDSTNALNIYGTSNSVNSCKGYGGIVQATDSALSDSFISQYSDFLYKKST